MSVHLIRSLLLSLVAAALCARPAAAQAPTPDVDSVLSRLPLEEKVAQLVMPWIGGQYASYDDPGSERIRRWVDSLRVGGVIVSIGSPLDVAARLNHLQRLAPLPLLVASDLEGGTAFRLTGGTAFPTNMGVGAAGQEADAYALGRLIALEGRAVGIHITFSPVADVNNNPGNPIINTRSFGEDPGLVARLVAAQVRGTQDHGMPATAKHFPGHGDTGTDSHLSLPVVQADWARLWRLELRPFRAAVEAGAELVMSAHVALPGIDSGRVRPATMVPEILTGVLRDSLGFRGLIVTDALDMGGVLGSYGEGEAAVRALLAGSDILLQPRDPEVAVRAVVAAVREGRVAEARVNASVRRLLALKGRLGLFTTRGVALDSVAVMVGRREHQELAADVSARAVVLLRDNGTMDSLARRPQRLALVTYGEGNGSGVGGTLAAELRQAGHAVTTFRLSPASGPASYDSARAVLRAAPYQLFAVAVRARESAGTVAMPAPLGQLLEESGRRATLVSFGSPYLATQTPGIGGYLLAWTSNPFTERAVARAFAGAAVTGRLPVSIPPMFRVGDGLRREARP